MGRAIPPCGGPGVVCEKRRVGCRRECEAWKAYQAVHAEEKEKMRKNRDAYMEAEMFMAQSGARARNISRLRCVEKRRKGM